MGPPSEIARAFCDFDEERLSTTSRGVADFSLHLSPLHLEFFVEEAVLMAGSSSIDPLEIFGHAIAGDRQECGAFQVSPMFVRLLASIPESRVNELAESWMARVSEAESDLEIVATSDSLQAVADLLRLAHEAQLSGHSIIYCWSL